jgi:hypothetical protein
MNAAVPGMLFKIKKPAPCSVIFNGTLHGAGIIQPANAFNEALPASRH